MTHIASTGAVHFLWITDEKHCWINVISENETLRWQKSTNTTTLLKKLMSSVNIGSILIIDSKCIHLFNSGYEPCYWNPPFVSEKLSTPENQKRTRKNTKWTECIFRQTFTCDASKLNSNKHRSSTYYLPICLFSHQVELMPQFKAWLFLQPK